MKLNRLFIALTAIGLATMLVSISAHAGRLAFDAAGTLFVADGHSIFKFAPDGEKSTFATGLNAPDLAFDSKGDLFASDFGQKSIFKFTPDGKKSTLATGIKVFGMVIDRSDNLYVSDGDSIFKFTADGNKSTFTTGIDAFEMVIDRSGNLYFSGSSGNSIFKFTPDWKKSTFASGLRPDKMAFDGAGNLFVADRSSHAIYRFAPDGTQSTFASEISAYELAFDRAGNLFFVSTGDSVCKFTPDGTKSTFAWMQVSPDNQWEYQCSDDGERAGIVKAGTTETVLDLSEDLPNADLLWTPDSKRFAVNSGSGRSHTTALYQLRGNKWVELRSPVHETSKRIERAQSAQLRKTHSPENGSRKHFGNADEVLKWADANTAILYAYSNMVVGETGVSAHFLFTLKFDNEGNWKIVKTHQMSDKEVEKEDAGEDVSGPAQTTDREGLRADASFRDADRHLNEVYNALRARLSPSERDRLKKEQLAWIDRRNAAGQPAKGNAEGNPTDAADREVTKMTLARVAELEKRLKKAK
jgi:uncharacterized protein YecT (DUF1311 family)/streptogramin lyase